MERNKFIQELERLVENGDITTHAQLQQTENISRTKAERYVQLGLYTKIRVGKIFILVKNNNE